MATHNQVRVVGYIVSTPRIVNEGSLGEEQILLSLRTAHRDLDGYDGPRFQDLMVFYDGTEMMEKMKKLKQFDVIDIKGVFNVLSMDKHSVCPGCKAMNTKYNGTSTFIYPISCMKLNAMQEAFEHNKDLPEEILVKHYMEVSNQALILGTVVSDPQMLGNEKHPVCRYRLGVDRKYYIKTQNDVTADYPWVYSFGKQAINDYRHLKQGSLILFDGFIQTRRDPSKITCSNCGQEYEYPDVETEFIPYSIEYLKDYMTDEDLTKKESAVARIKTNDAKEQIFSEN